VFLCVFPVAALASNQHSQLVVVSCLEKWNGPCVQLTYLERPTWTFQSCDKFQHNSPITGIFSNLFLLYNSWHVNCHYYHH
jgi:hypothetical protein